MSIALKEVTIQVPANVIASGMDAEKLQEGMILLLFQQNKLSEQQACQILKLPRREFEALLPTYGFALMDSDALTLEQELYA